MTIQEEEGTARPAEKCLLISFRGFAGNRSLSTAYCFFHENPNECPKNPGLDCVGHRMLAEKYYPPMKQTDLKAALNKRKEQ